jgi:YhcH/YjgK/YiaL family protein
MIIDNLLQASKYAAVHPLFATAFDYINKTDLAAIEVGKYDIAEGLKAIVSDKKGMTQAESCAKFECHNAHIDIQICISGNETLGWKPRSSCKNEREPYNAEKDVMFYTDAPDMFFQLSDNQFAVFFPEDVHAPMIGEGEIKKMVIKVKI